MRKTLAIVFALCAISLGQVYAEQKPVFIRGVRPLGMGGGFVAIADDQNAMFYNPAGLTQRQDRLVTFLEMPMFVSEDTIKMYDFYKDNEDHLKNFDSQPMQEKIRLINEIDRMSGYHANAGAGFPNTSYLSGPGFLSWGFGAYSQADFGFQMGHGVLVPNVSFWGNLDTMAGLPLAHRFTSLPYVPGSLSVGTTLKYIRRARIEELNKSVLEFENFDPVLQWGHGFGFDLGTIYQPNTRWNVGLQATDVGATNLHFDKASGSKGNPDKEAFDDAIPMQWNAGAAYIPSKICYWPGKSFSTHDRLLFVCDVRDFASTDEPLFEATFWKKLHMGTELRWGPLSLRGGYSSGYPSFGAGVRVPYIGLRIDYAYWADELGRYAGQMAQWNHQLTLGFSWGDGRGRAYGSDVKATVEPERTEATPARKEEPKAKAVPAEKQADGVKPTETAAPAAVPAAAAPAVPATDATSATAAPAAPAAKEAAPAAVAPAPAATDNATDEDASSDDNEGTEPAPASVAPAGK